MVRIYARGQPSFFVGRGSASPSLGNRVSVTVALSGLAQRWVGDRETD